MKKSFCFALVSILISNLKKLALILTVVIVSIAGINAQNDIAFLKDRIINLGEIGNNSEYISDHSSLQVLLKDVEIIMLGEQSHGEGTTYETKIKLIKYLHQELGFDLLVFESGFYDCHKAWQLIEQGGNVRDAMGRSIFSLWSTTKQLEPLAKYIEFENNNGRVLKLLGFDSQFAGKLSKEYFMQDLGEYLMTIDPEIVKTTDWEHLVENFNYSTNLQLKVLKKNQPEKDTIYINQLVNQLKNRTSDSLSNFWAQALQNTKVHLSDLGLKTDGRDKQMADNLFWIKEKYPNRKIICWGATSHFLYNSTEVRMKNPIIQLLGGNYYKDHPMMGHYVKEMFDEKLYTIGFTAFEGEFGLTRKRKIKAAKEGTLEYLLSQSDYDNFLLPLKDLNLENYVARPLGNFYMKTDIADVMDAVIFTRYMTRSRLDANFFLSIYPENKYIKPEVVE